MTVASVLWTVFSWAPLMLLFCLLLSLTNLTLGLYMPKYSNDLMDHIYRAKSWDDIIDLVQLLMTITVITQMIGIVQSYYDSRVSIFLGLNSQNYVLQRIMFGQVVADLHHAIFVHL